MSKIICKKDGYNDFIIDTESRGAESVLSAYLMNDWSCCHENGEQIQKPVFDKVEIQKKMSEDFTGVFIYDGYLR